MNDELYMNVALKEAKKALKKCKDLVEKYEAKYTSESADGLYKAEGGAMLIPSIAPPSHYRKICSTAMKALWKAFS